MAEFLGNEIDKSNNELSVYHLDKIGMSPVYVVFLKHMVDLIESGNAYPMTTWNDNCSAVYCTSDNVVIGMIVYEIKNKNVVWIVIGAVEKEHRSRGIYKILYKHLEKIGKQLGCDIISSYVHVNNQNRLDMTASLGMTPVFYYADKKI